MRWRAAAFQLNRPACRPAAPQLTPAVDAYAFGILMWEVGALAAAVVLLLLLLLLCARVCTV
jgi:hypothetical protein